MLYSINESPNSDGYTAARCGIVYPASDGYTSYQITQDTTLAIRRVDRIPQQNGIFGFVKQLWKLWTQARCKHTHFIRIDLDGIKRYSGESDLQLYFCYICGYVCLERKDHDSFS